MQADDPTPFRAVQNDSSDIRLPKALERQLEEIAKTPLLLVALDFDGTLSPEVDDPAEARAIPEANAAIERLLDVAQTRVALISGRAAESLIRVSRLPDSVLLIGSHGAEKRLDGPEILLTLTEEERMRVERLRAVLETVAEPLAHVWIENKPAGFALHTRLADEEDTRQATELALERTAVIDGLTVRHGKNVLEFSVLDVTKGEAVKLLREHTGATAVLFAGDDVTDEDGFLALLPGDLGLKSGPGPTMANARVNNPAEVAAALNRLADERRKHISGMQPE